MILFIDKLSLLLNLEMRSSGDQELFKVMSNRTRTRPQEIFVKMNTHISQLQDQVNAFNKTEAKLATKMQNHQIKNRNSSR